MAEATYTDVLVPTDGSEGTDRVVDHALGVAGESATVHALYVVDRRAYFTTDEDVQAAVRETLREQGEAAVERVADRAAGAGFEAVTAVDEGVPATAIVEYAEANGIDLVVMGTHGRTGRDRLAELGSVTERVLKHVSVPMLVVDIGAGDESA